MATETEWVSVGALGEAFRPDGNILEQVADLAGKCFSIGFENGWCIEFDIASASSLTWSIKRGEGEGGQWRESYTATRPRDGIYFVDFVRSGNHGESISLVLDFSRNVCTLVRGNMPSRHEAEVPFLKKIGTGRILTGVRTSIVRGSIGRPYAPSDAHHDITSDLLGKRIRYVYSPTETYEHIYLNAQFYTWHCLRGIEKGLCDTDHCHYSKIADNLYLFIWQEKIVPTLGVVMIDLDRLKTTGKIFGYSGYDFGTLTNFSIGAFASILNVVPLEEG